MCTHTYTQIHTCAPWPLPDPSVAQPGCRFQCKSSLQRWWAPCLQAKGKEGVRNAVSPHQASACYRMFLFLSCCWKRNKVGKGRGSTWRKDLTHRGIVIADSWVSKLWSLHGALLAEKTETHEIMAFSAFGRNSCSPLQQRRDTCWYTDLFLPESKNAIPGHCLPVVSWGETTSIPDSPHTKKISNIAGDELLRYSGFFSLTETDCNGWCGKNEIASGISLSLLFNR